MKNHIWFDQRIAQVQKEKKIKPTDEPSTPRVSRKERQRRQRPVKEESEEEPETEETGKKAIEKAVSPPQKRRISAGKTDGERQPKRRRLDVPLIERSTPDRQVVDDCDQEAEAAQEQTQIPEPPPSDDYQEEIFDDEEPDQIEQLLEGKGDEPQVGDGDDGDDDNDDDEVDQLDVYALSHIIACPHTN